MPRLHYTIARAISVPGAFALATMFVARTSAAEDDFRAIPVLRLGMGPAFHSTPAREKGAEVAVDGSAGFTYAFSDEIGLLLTPELGYTYDAIGLHAFQATVGVGFGHPIAFVAYRPHLILGALDGRRATGMRNGLSMHVLGDMGNLELAHQFVASDGVFHHDVRVMVGVNPAAFVFLLAALSS